MYQMFYIHPIKTFNNHRGCVRSLCSTKLTFLQGRRRLCKTICRRRQERSRQKTIKCWICLFIWFRTWAIHLEIGLSLSTAEFMQLAIRGIKWHFIPAYLISGAVMRSLKYHLKRIAFFFYTLFSLYVFISYLIIYTHRIHFQLLSHMSFELKPRLPFHPNTGSLPHWMSSVNCARSFLEFKRK